MKITYYITLEDIDNKLLRKVGILQPTTAKSLSSIYMYMRYNYDCLASTLYHTHDLPLTCRLHVGPSVSHVRRKQMIIRKDSINYFQQISESFGFMTIISSKIPNNYVSLDLRCRIQYTKSENNVYSF